MNSVAAATVPSITRPCYSSLELGLDQPGVIVRGVNSSSHYSTWPTLFRSGPFRPTGVLLHERRCTGSTHSMLGCRRRRWRPGAGSRTREALRRKLVPVAHKAANYGGVMLWDRYLDKRSNYSGSIKSWV